MHFSSLIVVKIDLCSWVIDSIIFIELGRQASFMRISMKRVLYIIIQTITTGNHGTEVIHTTTLGHIVRCANGY